MKFGQRFAIVPLALVSTSLALPAYSLGFPTTSDRGAPPRSIGAGTRGDICLDLTQQPNLSALLPHNSLATTFSADPDIDSALFFYVPETGAQSAELVVVDAEGEEVYKQLVTLPETAGVVQVNLPKSHSSGDALFAADSLYYWDFAIICDAEDRFSDVLIGGGLQRADADQDLLDQLEAVNDDPLAQADLYASQGAWQEAIVLAAEMRSQNPQPWRELLESVDLEIVADAPLVEVVEATGTKNCN